MTDLDPLLREAMTRVRGPVNSRPSLTDVRRRARRRNHRRMAATAGALACTGVAATALIIRRDVVGPSAIGVPGEATTTFPESAASSTIYTPLNGGTTTTVYGAPEMMITASKVWDALWNARYDPAGAALAIAPVDQAAADVMPTPEQFGCTAVECSVMFTYVVWHEIARELGFSDVQSMQAANPAIDFSLPPHEGDVLLSAMNPVATGASTTTFPATTLATECCPAPSSTVSVGAVVDSTSTSVVFEDPSIFTTTTSIG